MTRKILSILLLCLLFALAGCAVNSAALPSPAQTAAYPDKYNNCYIQDGRIYLADGSGGWNDVTPANIPPGDTINSALFINGNDGWVIDYSLKNLHGFTFFRTTDGGKNWDVSFVKISLNSGGVEMDFIDSNNGWILASQDASMGCLYVSVLRTTDGGVTWEVVSVTGGSDYDSTAGCLPSFGIKNGISFIDVNNGWVTGESHYDDLIYVYVTHDGGVTWQSQNIPLPDTSTGMNYETNLPMFFSAGYGILPVRTSDGTNLTMYFYSTTDSGMTWVLSSTIDGISLSVCYPQYCFSSDGQRGYMTNGVSLYAMKNDAWSKITPSASLTGVQIIYVGGEAGW